MEEGNEDLKDFSGFEKEEDFWTYVSQSYTVSPNIINLNNGGVSPSPKIVQDAVTRYNTMTNERAILLHVENP
jgi:hypothetical protein